MAPAARRRGRVQASLSLFGPVNPAARPAPSHGPATKPPAKAVAAARAARTAEAGATMERLRRIAAELARRFGLRYAVLEAERDGVHAHYGICYKDGRIRIRLRHATTGRLLKESSLVDTLCHELAHLRHFDHSPRFKDFYLRILEEARRRGYYRPGPDRLEGQGTLFDFGSCGTVPVGTRDRAPATQGRKGCARERAAT